MEIPRAGHVSTRRIYMRTRWRREKRDAQAIHTTFMCCAPKVANAEGRGPCRCCAGGEEDDEDGQQPAAAWRMLSGYERSREASMMVDALATVVAGGATPPATAGARQQQVSPEGQWWSDYYAGDVTPPPSLPAPAAHGNRRQSMQCTLPRLATWIP